MISIEAPTFGEDGKPDGGTRTVNLDQGVHATMLEGLAGLNPVNEGGIHTAGNSSGIVDGAALVLVTHSDHAAARTQRLLRLSASGITEH